LRPGYRIADADGSIVAGLDTNGHEVGNEYPERVCGATSGIDENEFDELRLLRLIIIYGRNGK